MMFARGCRFGGFTGKVVRVTRLKAVAIALFFLALGATSVNAQAPSQVRTGGRSTLSEIAHGISNWFTRGTDTDGNRHRERSLPPPLPRPRPPELTSAPVPSNKEPSELRPHPSRPPRSRRNLRRHQSRRTKSRRNLRPHPSRRTRSRRNLRPHPLLRRRKHQRRC
jgi:hypothetical protein